MKLTQAAAIALATAATQIRPEWQHAGILAALKVEADKGTSAEDVFVALARICRRPDVHTPGFLNTQGTHWTRDDGKRIERRGDHNQPCPDHPGEHDMPCPAPGDATDPGTRARLAAEVRAAIAAARTTPAQPRREPAPLTKPADRLEQVRALIPEETQDA